MTADRLTIYAGKAVQTVLGGIGPGKPGQGGDPGSKSGRLNAVCERYLLVCAASQPALTRGEWLALCDILNGTLIDAMTIRALELDVADSDLVQVERWGADRAALVARIHSMTLAERVAVVEAVEAWWRAEGDHDERLKAAGVRPAG